MPEFDPAARRLPPPYPHRHASAAARELAERGTILRVQVGSGLHGTGIAGQDDRDEMGICLEPAAFVTGVARVPAGDSADGSLQVEFEQYVRHTAWDRPGGLANRSGAGDLDVVIYAARKWCRLALAGNPTVLLPLFVPDSEVVYRTSAGAELMAEAARFVSRLAAQRFLGYLQAQRAAAFGDPGGRVPRGHHLGETGYDTKYAMHALRLGVQGAELLETGRITLPVPEPHRSQLLAVRRGEWSQAEVAAAMDEAVDRLSRLDRQASVSEQPDRAWVDDWLHRSHLEYWASLEA